MFCISESTHTIQNQFNFYSIVFNDKAKYVGNNILETNREN